MTRSRDAGRTAGAVVVEGSGIRRSRIGFDRLHGRTVGILAVVAEFRAEGVRVGDTEPELLSAVGLSSRQDRRFTETNVVLSESEVMTVTSPGM